MTASMALAVTPTRTVRVLTEALYRPSKLRAYGPYGFSIMIRRGSISVSQTDHDGVEWLHASLAREDRMPDYADLTVLKAAVFGDKREAYQIFPPADRHISIHDRALHLWGKADGSRVLPDFGAEWSIR
jgi:hypothetical protein